MRTLDETHKKGIVSIENVPEELLDNFIRGIFNGSIQGDFGLQIAHDGRVWVCINGIAFLRFKPEVMSHW